MMAVAPYADVDDPRITPLPRVSETKTLCCDSECKQKVAEKTNYWQRIGTGIFLSHYGMFATMAGVRQEEGLLP